MHRAPSSVLCVAAMFTVLSAAARAEPPLTDRIDGALDAAAAFLFEHQDEDGAWRSGVYGAYRDGRSLTAHVLAALVRVAPEDERTRRGLAYLAGLVNAEGEVDAPLIMPVYTAAQAAEAFMAAGQGEEARPWLALLLRHQMSEARGWSPDDAQYGGWGYSAAVPDRPADDERAARVDANISATAFALAALRRAERAGVIEVERSVFERALYGLVLRCQNVTAPGPPDEAFDDGGFFFTPVDAVRNKAGAAGRDAAGRERFHSYGSATADGYRALVLSGGGAGRERTPRMRLAGRWLDRHFDPATVPGAFNEDREVLRDASYFYYAWSMSVALRRWPADGGHGGSAAEHRRALAEELLRRQDDDGSWANRFTDAREDDPLIATPFAALALIECGPPNSARLRE